MKLDSDIRDLLKGVLRTSILFCAIECVLAAALYAAGAVGSGADEKSIAGVVIGAAGGTAVAVLVFWWMCVSLQKSLDKAAQGGAAVKKGVQTGYAQRMLVQGLWVVAAALAPFINTICGLVPLLFPKMAIYVLQKTGKLKLTQKTPGEKGGET